MTAYTPTNPFKTLVEAITASRDVRLLTRVAEARRQRREALAAAQAEVDEARANYLIQAA